MIEQTVKGILSEELNIEPIKISSEFSQKDFISWDSLKHINIVISLEKKFKTEFEPEEISEMHSFSSIVKIVENKIK